MLTKNHKANRLYFFTLLFLLTADLANADLIDARKFITDEDAAFLQYFEDSGENWHGVIKKKFTNPDRSASEVLSISFPTSTYTVDYASEFVEWENKPEDVIFNPIRITSAERLMSKGVYKIADFNDLFDVIGLGHSLETGYTEAEILPARALSISVELDSFRKLVARGYPTTLSELTLSAELFGVGDIRASYVEELIKSYELQSLDIFAEITPLGVGDSCYHTFNTASFQQTGYEEIASIGVVSGCVIAGLNIVFSNIKYVNNIPDTRYVIETAYFLSKQTEDYVKLVEVSYE